MKPADQTATEAAIDVLQMLASMSEAEQLAVQQYALQTFAANCPPLALWLQRFLETGDPKVPDVSGWNDVQVAGGLCSGLAMSEAAHSEVQLGFALGLCRLFGRELVLRTMEREATPWN